MKKILSLALAAVMAISAVPMAYAADTQDYSLGTAVEFTAANNESYTITVPAALQPGQSGTVTLEGTWAANRIVTVTADSRVILTNSINSADRKSLYVMFVGGISKAGSNTESQTFSKTISVSDITDAIFGSWSGKFNYNVTTSDLNPDDGSTPADGEVYRYGDYKYTYSAEDNGWAVRTTNYGQTSYGPILESINGAPITSMENTFAHCPNLTVAPEIPASVTNMSRTFMGCTSLTEAPVIPNGVTYLFETFYMCTSLTEAPVIPSGMTGVWRTFEGCTSLTGTVTINGNITDNHGYWGNCFYGVDFEAQNLTLAGDCSILDTIGATGTNYCADCNGKCQGHATLITFAIDGVEYQTEEGMLWIDWCNSEYNTGNFIASSNTATPFVYTGPDTNDTVQYESTNVNIRHSIMPTNYSIYYAE